MSVRELQNAALTSEPEFVIANNTMLLERRILEAGF
jgi:hypothetical protein